MGKPTTNDSDEDVEAPKEETEAEENERKCKEEEEKQAAKEKQERAECMHVIIAMVVIMGMAAAVVYLKLEYFPVEKVITFKPLLQQVWDRDSRSPVKVTIWQVKSNVRYNGNGYLPCGGQVPTPLDCDFPPYYMKVPTGWWWLRNEGRNHSLTSRVSTKGRKMRKKICNFFFFIMSKLKQKSVWIGVQQTNETWGSPKRLFFTCP